MLARMMLIQPDAERCPEQRGNHHRPADQPHHPQTEPHALRGVTPCLELAGRLCADLLAERRFRLCDFVLGFISHCEGSPCAVVARLPFSPTPSARFARARSGSKTLAPPLCATGRGPLRLAPGARTRVRPDRSSREPLHPPPRKSRHLKLSRRSESRALAPPRNRVDEAGAQTSPHVSRRRCGRRQSSRRKF